MATTRTRRAAAVEVAAVDTNPATPAPTAPVMDLEQLWATLTAQQPITAAPLITDMTQVWDLIKQVAAGGAIDPTLAAQATAVATAAAAPQRNPTTRVTNLQALFNPLLNMRIVIGGTQWF